MAVNSINYGNQVIVWGYHQEACSKGFNQAFCDILPYGVYTGGHLTRLSNTNIQVSPLTCIIRSNEHDKVALRIETSEVQDLVINQNEPYIVLRFGWADADNVFMDIRSVGWSSDPLEINENKLLPFDIILGKVQFTEVSGTMVIDPNNSFDLTRRKDVFLKEIENVYTQFQVSESEINPKRVHVSGGRVNTSKGRFIVHGGEYPDFDIPDTDARPRTDIIIVDVLGKIRLIQGTPAVNPVAPKYGTYKVIAEIRRGANRTNIRGSDIVQLMDASRRGQWVAEDFEIADIEDYLPVNAKNIETAFNYVFHHSLVMSPDDISVLAKVLRKHIKFGITDPNDVYAGSLPVKDTTGLFIGTNVEAVLAEIAGSGRTTETLKGLADAIDALNNSIKAHTDNKDNPHAVTKIQVGLGNVDNTADIDKPVSIAQQAAINVEKAAREAADTVLQNNKANKITYPAISVSTSEHLIVNPPYKIHFDTSKTPSITPDVGSQGIIGWQVVGHPLWLFGLWTNDGITTKVGLFEIENNNAVEVRSIYDGTTWFDDGVWTVRYGIDSALQVIGMLSGFDINADMTIPALPIQDLTDIVNNKQDNITSMFDKRTVVISEVDGKIEADTIEIAEMLDGSDRKMPTNKAVYDVISTETITRQNADNELSNRIEQVQGKGGPITAHDFGSEAPTQEALTEYACESIWGAGGAFEWNGDSPVVSTYVIGGIVHTAGDMFNNTWVRNTYNGINHRIVLVNTSDTNPAVYSWEDVGYDTVGIATATLPGLVMSGGDVEIDPITGNVAIKDSDKLDGQEGSYYQSKLARTVGGNDNATGTVSDAGGNLSVPIPLMLAAASATATQNTATAAQPLRTWAQSVRNNIAQLFNADTTNYNKLVERAKRSLAVTVGFDSNYCDFNVSSYASADLAIQAAINAVGDGGTVVIQNGWYTFKGAVTINKHNITVRGHTRERVYITYDAAYTGNLFQVAGADSSWVYYSTFENLTFHGNNSGVDRAMISLYYAQRVHIRKCNCRDFRGWFVKGYRVEVMNVTECFAYNIYKNTYTNTGWCCIEYGAFLTFTQNHILWMEAHKLYFAECTRVVINGNIFENSGVVRFTGTGNAQIAITGNVFTHAGLVVPSSVATSVSITGNVRYGSGELSIDGATVAGNVGF
jgi:hypothetical protein